MGITPDSGLWSDAAKRAFRRLMRVEPCPCGSQAARVRAVVTLRGLGGFIVFRSIRRPLGRIVLSALLATWATVPAFQSVADTSDAIYEPAGTLRRACDSKEKVESEICFVFVVTTLEIAINNRIYGLTVCPPPHTNGQQAVKIARTWLNTYPEDELLPASQVVTDALAAAFPCDGRPR
jgi:hypothetical protein